MATDFIGSQKTGLAKYAARILPMVLLFPGPLPKEKSKRLIFGHAFSLIEGGSTTAVSVGTAAKYACNKIAKSLLKEAGKIEDCPFREAKLEEVIFEDGLIKKKNNQHLLLSLPV